MDAIRASAAYNAKLTAARVEAFLTYDKATMVSNYAATAGDLYDIENTVKGILGLITSPAPIPVTDYPLYYSFAKQCYRKARILGGGAALTVEIGYLITTYVARGLVDAALDSIVAALSFGP